MDFGIFLDFALRPGGTAEEAFQESFELVDLAEQMGLDTVWLGEGHFRPNRSVLSAPIVVASAIAARTTRLRVGMAVQVLPLIHPLRIAEEAVTVDQISQGRFEFGIGRSGNVRAYDIMGIDYAESKERFQEALDIILKAWSGEPFSYEGSHYRVRDLVERMTLEEKAAETGRSRTWPGASQNGRLALTPFAPRWSFVSSMA
jgi:alkanesulfonate monooxygenase SsuD/methylene tetrahydromethanopterin reductase-like flavin-dependent oxidoreductase (luciferase family)